MDAAVAQELGMLEPGDRPEDALLVGNLEPRLEAHEVPHLPGPVFLPQLNDRVLV